MGFIPIPALDPHHPSTSFRIAGRRIKLDLLTPLTGPHKTKPIALPALKSYAKALRFLDYLIEDYVPVVLINGDGILANVPHPARFAWHKLIICNRRPITEQAKREKDLLQAKQLLEVLVNDRPGDLELAWDALVSHGKAWVKEAKRGFRQLDADLIKRVSDLIPDVK